MCMLEVLKPRPAERAVLLGCHRLIASVHTAGCYARRPLGGAGPEEDSRRDCAGAEVVFDQILYMLTKLRFVRKRGIKVLA